MHIEYNESQFVTFSKWDCQPIMVELKTQITLCQTSQELLLIVIISKLAPISFNY